MRRGDGGGRPDSWTVSGSLRSAREWDLPHEMLDAREIRRRFPTLSPADDEVALYEAKAGLLRPENTVAAHLQLATRQGADLHFDEPMTRWEPYRDGVRVHTAENTYTASRLVICPGAWAPRLLADLGVPFTVERQVMYWFQPKHGYPSLPPRQAADLRLGGRVRRPGVRLSGHRRPRHGCQGRLLPQGARHHPGNHRPDGVRPRGRGDGRPHVRPHPGSARDLPQGRDLHVHHHSGRTLRHRPAPRATRLGHCGLRFLRARFQFVPVVGEILADLALTGSTAHPIGLFDPARLAAAAPVSGALT